MSDPIPKVPVTKEYLEKLTTSSQIGYTYENWILVDPKRLRYLVELAEVADKFEEWINANAGCTDDWIIRIKSDQEGYDALVSHLNALTDALAPLRMERRAKRKGKPLTPSMRCPNCGNIFPSTDPSYARIKSGEWCWLCHAAFKDKPKTQ